MYEKPLFCRPGFANIGSRLGRRSAVSIAARVRDEAAVDVGVLCWDGLDRMSKFVDQPWDLQTTFGNRSR